MIRDFDAPRDCFRRWTARAFALAARPTGLDDAGLRDGLTRRRQFRWRWRTRPAGVRLHRRVSRDRRPSRSSHGATIPARRRQHGREPVTRCREITTYTTTIRFQSKADRDAAVSTGMTDGMEQSFAQLDALLAAPAEGARRSRRCVARPRTRRRSRCRTLRPVASPVARAMRCCARANPGRTRLR